MSTGGAQPAWLPRYDIIEVKTIDVFEIEFFRSELKKYQLNSELDVYDVLVPLN